MKRNIILLIVLTILIPRMVIGQATMANQPDDSSMGLPVLLVFCLLILVVLTLWLFKSSSRLAEVVEDRETNGEVWLKSHLKDLDNHQLDILIKRQPIMRTPSLNDEKPNKQ